MGRCGWGLTPQPHHTCSDNVLNTGFCPRADRDSLNVFTNALSFTPHSPDTSLLPLAESEKSRNGKTKVYAPPNGEFNVLVTSLCNGQVETVRETEGPNVMYVKGVGEDASGR
jgi:mannose-6-phosphate isomerase